MGTWRVVDVKSPFHSLTAIFDTSSSLQANSTLDMGGQPVQNHGIGFLAVTFIRDATHCAASGDFPVLQPIPDLYVWQG